MCWFSKTKATTDDTDKEDEKRYDGYRKEQLEKIEIKNKYFSM
jgi:hypothetical protein